MSDTQSLQSLQFSLTSNIDRASRQWRRLARDVVTAHGISEACAMPLIAIGRMGDGLRQGMLADELGIEGPSLVRLLDQLSASGLVERRDDPSDRRAKTLWLTEKGRRITRWIEAGLVELRAEVFADLKRGDLEAALRVFAVLERAAGLGASHRQDVPERAVG